MSAFPKPLLRLAFPFCSCPECSPLSPNYNSLSKRARDRFEALRPVANGFVCVYL